MSKDIGQLLTRVEKLFSTTERHNSELMWNDLSKFLLNNQHGIFVETTATNIGSDTATSSTPGSKKTLNIYDSTGAKAAQDLASAIHGTLTNPATIWSKFRFLEDDLNNTSEAVKWLEEANKQIHNKYQESNFQTEIAKGYQSFTAFANMAAIQEDDTEGSVVFTSFHLGQLAWSEDKKHNVDTVYRKFTFTARQAVQKWEGKLHKNIVSDSIKDSTKEYSFVHCIFPRDKKDIKLNELGLAPGENRPVASVYIDMTHKEFIEESGYYEFPVHIARWGLMPGEVYGRGPGHLALPDVKTLNELVKLGLQSTALKVKPPFFVNQRDIFGSSFNLKPGQATIVKDHRGIREFTSQSNTEVLKFSQEELKTSIREHFFLDKLLLPPRTETGEQTAFEIAQRIEQTQRVLGPSVLRLNNEMFNPLVIRTFKIMLRNGELPELPNILKERGVNIEIIFVNQLARAQQIQEVSTIRQWIGEVAVVAQLNPQVIDNINVDGVAKHIAKILGVPEEAVQNDEVVEEIRLARQQAAQQQQALDSGVKAADTISKLDTE